MTDDEPMTPEQLETQKHNLAFFKGYDNYLDFVWSVKSHTYECYN